jgi:hypothetical protein
MSGSYAKLFAEVRQHFLSQRLQRSGISYWPENEIYKCISPFTGKIGIIEKVEKQSYKKLTEYSLFVFSQLIRIFGTMQHFVLASFHHL